MQDPSRFMGPPENSDPLYRRLLKHMAPGGLHVDLGCGHGRFLEVSRNSGNPVLGVDEDSISIEDCLDRNIPAVEQDAFQFLEQACPTADAITAIHLVEHLVPRDAERLFALVHSRLAPGGRFLLVTPNFADVTVSGRIFWLDPTHIRPYPLELLAQMAYAAGLEQRVAFVTRGVRGGRRSQLLAPLQRLRYGKDYGRLNAVFVCEKPRG